MVQRDQVPEEVNDIEKYIQEKFTFQDAIDDAEDIDVFIDDDGGSITIDTDGTELDLVVQDIVDALEQATDIDVSIDEPISVDDNGTSITVDSDSGPIDINVPGTIPVSDDNGSLTIDTDNGPIDVDADLSGELVSVDDNGGSITVDTDLGSLTVDIGNEPIDVDADLSGEVVGVTDNGGSLTIDTASGAIDVSVPEPLSIDDNGGSLTIDTDDGPVDVSITGQPIDVDADLSGELVSVDDNGSSITIDTDDGPVDVDTQDVLDALNTADYVNSGTMPSTSGIPPNLRTHSFGLQPDNDLVPEKADGQAFLLNGGFDASETVTSEWIETDGWRTIEIVVLSNVQSAEDGVEIQFTSDVQADSPDVDASTYETFANEGVVRGFNTFDFGTRLDGFRLSYTNGDVASNSNAAIICTLREIATPDSAEYVKTDSVGDSFVTVGTDPARTGVGIAEPASLFGDLRTIERRTVIDATSTFGTSTLRDEITSTGSGSIEQNPAPSGEIQIGTGTTANSSVEIQTAEYGRYTPGFSAQAGVGIRLPTKPTEGEARWGYFDQINGFYWGFDGDQGELFIARRKSGSEIERIYRSNWNREEINDRLNRTWEPTEGDIFQIDFSWYGYGLILFTLVTQSTDDNLTGTPRQVSIPVHAISVRDESSTSDPNQPIRVEVENGDTGEDIDVYLGGRQFSVFGEPPAEQRITAGTSTNVSIGNGTWTYIQSWRRDPSEDANSKLNIQDLTGFANGDLRIALLVDPDISGTAYDQPDLVSPEETLLEVSKTGSFNALGNGTKVWEDVLNATGSGRNASGNLAGEVNVRLGQENELVLIAQGIGNSLTYTGTLRMLEDW